MQNDFNEENKAMAETDIMQEYLEDMYRKGAELFVDGQAVMPCEVMRRTVREDCIYMADYVMDQTGKIEQIRFDRLNLL